SRASSVPGRRPGPSLPCCLPRRLRQSRATAPSGTGLTRPRTSSPDRTRTYNRPLVRGLRCRLRHGTVLVLGRGFEPPRPQGTPPSESGASADSSATRALKSPPQQVSVRDAAVLQVNVVSRVDVVFPLVEFQQLVEAYLVKLAWDRLPDALDVGFEVHT